MRAMILLSALLCWCGLASSLPAQDAEPVTEERVTVITVRKKKLLHEEIVEGFGTDLEMARKNAYETAAVHVRKWVQKQHRDFQWTPSIEYLQQTEIAKPSTVKIRKGEKPSKFEKATVQISINRKQYKQLLEQDHLSRLQGRHYLWGKILTALLVMLGLFAAHLKLEEMTQGYLTKLLRTALLIGVSLTIAGLWYWVS